MFPFWDNLSSTETVKTLPLITSYNCHAAKGKSRIIWHATPYGMDVHIWTLFSFFGLRKCCNLCVHERKILVLHAAHTEIARLYMVVTTL